VGATVRVAPCWGRVFVAVIVALDGAWCWVEEAGRTRLVPETQVTVLAEPPREKERRR
jgi:hypothetical protein